MVASYPSMNVAAGEDRFPPRTFQIRELQAVLIKPAGPIVNIETIRGMCRHKLVAHINLCEAMPFLRGQARHA
jgi:hypothetical protein